MGHRGKPPRLHHPQTPWLCTAVLSVLRLHRKAKNMKSLGFFSKMDCARCRIAGPGQGEEGTPRAARRAPGMDEKRRRPPTVHRDRAAGDTAKCPTGAPPMSSSPASLPSYLRQCQEPKTQHPLRQGFRGLHCFFLKRSEQGSPPVGAAPTSDRAVPAGPRPPWLSRVGGGLVSRPQSYLTLAANTMALGSCPSHVSAARLTAVLPTEHHSHASLCGNF